MNAANSITLGRLLVVPVVVWLIVARRPDIAFWFFAAAGVSDALDGFVAKRLNQVSELGGLMDAVADKVLLVSVFLTLGQQGYLPPWLVILVVSRDAMIVGGALLSYALSLPSGLRPLQIGKINTLAQIVLAGTVLADIGLRLSIGGVVEVLIVLVAATTLVSGGSYLARWMRSTTQVEAR